MSKNILVTGGAGFIGSNLIKKLLLADNNIIVVDDLSKGSLKYLPNSDILRKGDIRDTKFLGGLMKGIDIVIHLAAYGSVIESVNDPYLNFDINVNGTFNVLNEARIAGVKKFIFASTGGALIGNTTPPVNEQSLPKPISPYGSSKLCGEAYNHSFAKAYNMNTVCLRFANVYGSFSAHKTGAVTKFIKCLLEDKPIPIYGDGSASRDYLHVDDLCIGIIKAVSTNLNSGSVLHLASGNEVTVHELAKMLSIIADKPNHPIKFLNKRPGEVERNFAQYEKAKNELNFDPTINFENGLKSTWQWFKNALK